MLVALSGRVRAGPAGGPGSNPTWLRTWDSRRGPALAVPWKHAGWTRAEPRRPVPAHGSVARLVAGMRRRGRRRARVVDALMQMRGGRHDKNKAQSIV